MKRAPSLTLATALLALLACDGNAAPEPETTGGSHASAGGATSGSGGLASNAGALHSAGVSGLGGMAVSSGGAPSGGGGATSSISGQAGVSSAGTSGGSSEHWVGTWACAPQTVEPANLPPAPGLTGNTLRQVLRVSRGGAQVRLRLSNEFGTSAVSMSAVRLALSKGAGAIDATTDKAMSFAGSPSVTVGAGQAVFSDLIDFKLEPLASLAVSIHFSSQSGEVTGHPGSRTTSFLQPGDAVQATSLPAAIKTEHWYFMTGLDVMADEGSGAVAVLGDSITDGRGSTTDGNDRWTDVLAQRLQGSPATSKIGVLNLGIGGNAVLSGGLGPPALQRFDRDVLQQSGVRWLIVLEGVNDIGSSGSPAVTSGLIAAYETFVAKANAANVRAYGVPILPIAGSQYESAEGARQTVNDWIRSSGTFAAVLDLDAAVRDPGAPTRLQSAYDSGDHLHLSPSGYAKMAQAVDLSLFGP